MLIPLSVPDLGEAEKQAVLTCLDSGWVSTAGPQVQTFEAAMADYTGARYAVAVSSGTAALHLALQVAGIGPGDRVLVPNLTFVASVNPIRYLGAVPVLVDVDPETWHMDLALVADYLRHEPAKAILPVHVLGGMTPMDKLKVLAEKHSLTVIEDAAEALGATYRGRSAGTWGSLGILSFNGNKIITSGGGGMILTDDATLAAQARHLSQQAKVPGAEYIHDQVGYNYRLPALSAALGLAQLQRLPDFLARKRAIYTRYREAFPAFDFPAYPTGVGPNHWLPTMRVPDREGLQQHLAAQGIETRPLWKPISRLPMYQSLLYLNRKDVSGSLYKQALSLPASVGLSKSDQEIVISTIQKFFR